ncbi:MAG: excinuclease ABC subunit UvrC [Clostridiales Family XIII bacterium]|jgi:excinuclease ABC subunit C|nr:excinuclease ABC subunit UvrC [Clostridiales Family XIII bacterium]
MFDIEDNLKKLPDKPGIYLHKDEYGEVIYVGKASSLRKRVRQYFRSQSRHDPKIAALVSHIAEFETIVTQTEMEALILENTLIKKYLPKYNVMLRDDKTYPYIKITLGEEWPRIEKTRVLRNDGSKYFGPYADVKSVNRIIELLRDVYRLKRCRTAKFPEGAKLCMYGHIGRCRGFCCAAADRDEYMADIDSVIAFLKGKNKETLGLLKHQMEEAAAALDFEKAAYWRDTIIAANSVIEKQRVDLLSSGNMDIVLAADHGAGNSDAGTRTPAAQVTVFFVRDGRLSGREIHHLDAPTLSTKEEVVSAFMLQYYINQTIVPKEILLESHIPDEALLQEMLTKNAGRAVKIEVPARGEKRALLKLALNDVSETSKLMLDMIERGKEKARALSAELADAHGLPAPRGGENAPLRIEAYDISNTGGADSVGAMVVFEGERPVKNAYRRFRIRGDVRGDDYAAMQEVLYRRLRREQDGAKGFERLPDVILVDGGKGHVTAALQITEAIGADVRVAGMVKDDRHRTRGLVTAAGDEIDLRSKPELFHLVGNIQEEVHRFVIEYHRGARKAKAVRSQLDEINGVGEKRRNALLMAFGSIDAIRAADKEALAAVPGMNARSARAVREYFDNNGPPR